MDGHRNNFGLLRLVLASAVIVGHSFELVDGDPGRDPVYFLCGNQTLGGLALDGFFVLSGFLITMSRHRSRSVWVFLWRRVMRIYPAFIVAFVLAAFAFGPLVGGRPFDHLWQELRHLLLLRPPPDFPEQLKGLHQPHVAAALWTIGYEFRCYLLVALLGAIGALDRRWPLLLLAGVSWPLLVWTSTATGAAAFERLGHVRVVEVVLGDAAAFVRLFSAFLVGACVYRFRNPIVGRLTGRVALVCGGLAALSMTTRHGALVGEIVFGGVALLWLGLKADLGRWQRVNDRWDISYGVYLYGWPIQTAIIWWFRGVQPVVLAPVTLLLAVLCGAASWFALERHARSMPLPGRFGDATARTAAS